MRLFKKSVIVLLFVSTLGVAQTDDLTTMFTFKMGAIGGWISLEQPVNEKILIHLEYGQEFGLYGSSEEGTQFFSTGTISLEPRYYYNRDKRESLGKSLKSNSGNYLAFEIQRIPDWGTADTGDRILTVEQSTAFIPKIGMKRNIGNAMTYEIAGGIGYAIVDNAKNTVAVAIDIKLGFLLFRN